MENNTNIMTEEIMEAVVEEIVPARGMNPALKVGIIGVAATGVAVVGYKKVVKPAVAKIKAKRAEKKAMKEANELVVGVVDSEE